MTATARPRWSVSGRSSSGARIVCRDGHEKFFLSAPMTAPRGAGMTPDELSDMASRIVALLNATELTTDAVSTLQYACMSAAESERTLADATLAGHVDHEQLQRIGTLNMLLVMLNHVARVWVELTEEATMQLDLTGDEA